MGPIFGINFISNLAFATFLFLGAFRLFFLLVFALSIPWIAVSLVASSRSSLALVLHHLKSCHCSCTEKICHLCHPPDRCLSQNPVTHRLEPFNHKEHHVNLVHQHCGQITKREEILCWLSNFLLIGDGKIIDCSKTFSTNSSSWVAALNPMQPRVAKSDTFSNFSHSRWLVEGLETSL
jgi:hypothetical protein